VRRHRFIWCYQSKIFLHLSCRTEKERLFIPYSFFRFSTRHGINSETKSRYSVKPGCKLECRRTDCKTVRSPACQILSETCPRNMRISCKFSFIDRARSFFGISLSMADFKASAIIRSSIVLSLRYSETKMNSIFWSTSRWSLVIRFINLLSSNVSFKLFLPAARRRLAFFIKLRFDWLFLDIISFLSTSNYRLDLARYRRLGSGFPAVGSHSVIGV
jgi:hypothetical protein